MLDAPLPLRVSGRRRWLSCVLKAGSFRVVRDWMMVSGFQIVQPLGLRSRPGCSQAAQSLLKKTVRILNVTRSTHFRPFCPVVTSVLTRSPSPWPKHMSCFRPRAFGVGRNRHSRKVLPRTPHFSLVAQPDFPQVLHILLRVFWGQGILDGGKRSAHAASTEGLLWFRPLCICCDYFIWWHGLK